MAYVINDSCVSCGTCAGECPVGAISAGDSQYVIDADTCLDCGYCDEFNNQCPECGSTNIQQLRRVTGYLTGNYKTAFNYGKQKETEDRVKHTGNMEE